jgi:DNA repair exonuclease SbcCD ATPase subunit
MQELLKGARANTYIAAPPDVPVEILVETKYNLLGDKQNLEMEVARLTARLSAIEQQIANTNRQIETKIADDRVTAELQRLVDMHVEQLENAKRLVEAGRASSGELTDMTEKLTRARIELLQRREQLSKSLGGDQLTKFNSELADIMIDLAEKRAELQVVSKQLRDAEGRLAAATTFDPEVAQMRLARQEFEVLDRRLSELKTRLTALRPPTVTVLGVD